MAKAQKILENNPNCFCFKIKICLSQQSTIKNFAVEIIFRTKQIFVTPNNKSEEAL